MKKNMMNTIRLAGALNRFASVRYLFGAMALVFLTTHACAQEEGLRPGLSIAQVESSRLDSSVTQSENGRTGLSIAVPNGYATLSVDDLRVQSLIGEVRWTRAWDGSEWKFNSHWESLSQSWKNLTGSQIADTTGTQLSAGNSGGDGCWVWVDEDWQPSTGITMIGGIPQAGPMLAVRTTPFNRLMGEAANDYPPPMRVSVDYANLCAGTLQSSGVQDIEGIRLRNELYLGEGGQYAFNNRSTLEKRAVKALPSTPNNPAYALLGTGQMALTPVTIDKGYRWQDRSGDWIDYNTQGQVVAYGDKNDNTIWLQRDTDGVLRGVVDANGRVLTTLHYTGALITEVKDYPIASNSQDLPARSVKYEYDDYNRLIQVTDVRGYVTKYDYNGQNRIVKITDQEGRIEQLTYNGEMVAKRTAPDGGVTDYLFEYDDTNKQFVSKITGPEIAAGRRVEEHIHNRVGKLVRRIVNGRTEESVQYDTGARAEMNTNARGFTTRTIKNEFEQVVEVAQPDGTSVKRSYSVLHMQLTEQTDELGIKTQYQYDAKGNLLKKIEAAATSDERVIEYEISSLGKITKVSRKGRLEATGTMTPDATWQIEYDDRGQIKKTVDPEGSIRQYAYDRAGNLVSHTDPRGNTTLYEVDANGNLIKSLDAMGRIRTYAYDKVGNLVTYTDARSKATQVAYDAMNRRTHTINPVSGIRKQNYNGQGLLVAETDEDGRTNQTEYDNFLRIVKQVDALGNTMQFGYQIADGSASGQLGSLTEPTEVNYPTFSQQTKFDERERPTNQTLKNPNSQGTDNLISSTAYDKRGLVTSETDANGKIRTYIYDALGQRTEATDALGGKTRSQYDVRGNLLQIADAKGNVHSFEYDRNNRIVKEVFALGQSMQFSYDSAGNVSERVNPNGNKFAYTYDAANRLIEIKQYKADSTLMRTTTRTWDAADNIVAWSDIDATRPSGQQTTSGSATFDDANRKTGEMVSYPTPSGDTYSLTYGAVYSLAGKKTQLTWPDGTQISYGYSAHGELDSVIIPGEGTLSVEQFTWTAPAQTILPGGTMQSKTYDGLLNLEGFKVKTPGQQIVLDIANGYGKVQELKTSKRTDSIDTGSNIRNSSYQYDDEIRLKQVATDSGDTEDFTLDPVGNRVAHSRQPGAWIYDANNRLTQRGTGANAVSYEYDDEGNLTKKTEPGNKVTRYSYDTQNRLTQVSDGNNALIARYGYDPLDRRIWKEQYRDREGNALTQAKRTYYLYADEGLIAESQQDITLNADLSVSVAAAPQITTQYGPRPEAEFTTGMLFIKTKNSNGQDTFAYYHHDHLQTPIQATDKQGNLVWSAEYEAFGKATITTPAATVDTPIITSNLRFPGQYADDETGLHYNFRRYYDPSIGRYITQDPLGLDGGINLYIYANDNPITLSDPRGENPLIIRAAIAAAIAGIKAGIKKCMSSPPCKCRAVYAGYKSMCGVGCRGASCAMLTAQEGAAELCYLWRQMYINMNCDRYIPTRVNHPGQQEQAKAAYNNCKKKKERACGCGS